MSKRKSGVITIEAKKPKFLLTGFEFHGFDEPYSQELLNAFKKFTMAELKEQFDMVDDIEEWFPEGKDVIVMEQYSTTKTGYDYYYCGHCFAADDTEQLDTLRFEISVKKQDNVIDLFREETNFCKNCRRPLFVLVNETFGMSTILKFQNKDLISVRSF